MRPARSTILARSFALGQKQTCAAHRPMSALGQKRTLRRVIGMSALCQKRTYALQQTTGGLGRMLTDFRQEFARGLKGFGT